MSKKNRRGLLEPGPQRTFTGKQLSQISFPLGGIGTGSVGLSGLGGLKDWEIFNRPNVGENLPFTFPLLYAREKGKEPVCRVAQGPALPPFVGNGLGDPHSNGEGFPHMDSCTFRGEYPFAWIDFKSRKMPVKLSLEAYNPFIPGDADASGFPAAILKYTLKNRTKNPVDATLAWSLFNPVGTVVSAENSASAGDVEQGLGGNVNRPIETGNLRGLEFISEKWAGDHPRFGQVALTTPQKNVTLMKYWSREGWFTPFHRLWDAFSATGELPDQDYGPSDEGQSTAGAVGVKVKLKPGASKTVTFYLTWYFPNYEKYWHEGSCGPEGCCGEKKASAKPVWKNYYASQFESAVQVAECLHTEEERLHARTARFHQALFSSTLPPAALDAVSSQMAILKTATCLRLTDGTFYAFEGCAPGWGCCEGSCTHVWNYQQTLPFLFPELERSMRTADYTHNLRDNGSMAFRIQLPIGSPPNDFLPCGDGQMGGVIKTYRDWKISGDDGWLRQLWPRVKRSLEYAWVDWDPEKKGVMTGIQHNTYDIEFHGPNPLMGFFYLGGLAAGAEMAAHLGDDEAAGEYRAVYEKGRAWMEEHLFNGEYFVQLYDPEKVVRHQFGSGCLSDQVLGQWVAAVAGLGHLVDPKLIRKTLRSIFRYNWKSDLGDHANAQRVYACGDEAGLLLCSWPRGERPAIPFVYSDEVWTGIEYQVASHCITEGLVEEGIRIVQAARERHNGENRNPWDEFECGHHYARAMAAYGLLLGLSGFRYDKGAGIIGFAPRVEQDNFRCFWALDGAWGTYAQKGRTARLEVLEGELTVSRIDLPRLARKGEARVSFGKKTGKAPGDQFGSITLPKTLHPKPGKVLTIKT